VNRRAFLKVTAGAASAAAVLPQAWCAAPKRNLRKAIMYSTIGVKGSVLEKFRAMKDAGFEGIEPLGGMARDEVLAAFKETGLKAASVCDHIHWTKTLSSPSEATRKEGFDGLLTALRDAHAYGAGSVLLVPGVVSGASGDPRRLHLSGMLGSSRSLRSRKAIPVARELGVKNLHRERRQQFHHNTRTGG
jgi:hexulose-6-phosphate isomerase